MKYCNHNTIGINYFGDGYYCTDSCDKEFSQHEVDELIELKDSPPTVVPAYSDHPIHGQTEHFVCSHCGQDVDKDQYCDNHGFIQA